ncbi:MAG: AEC family transporter, partial [Coriobacteriales bacterium]|nr:AEC family transporter [Coriobacteriales bacterium]
MSAFALAQTILAFVAIVGVGAILRATGVLTAEDAKPLNAVIVYVGLPAYIFRAVYSAQLNPALLRVVAVAWLVFGAMLLIAWLLARSLKLPPLIAGGFIIGIALGNTGYIGYPVTEALLGADALTSAVFFDVFCTAFALVLFGFAIAQHYGSADAPRAHPLRELATFPPVIALAVALLLRLVPIPLPTAVSLGLDLTASMVAPLIMLSVGLALRPQSARAFVAPLAIVAVLRLLVAPAIAYVLGTAIVGPGEALRVV